MDGETVEESLSSALKHRLACYAWANEILALAKLAAHTWLQIWVFSGHPSVRIGSLVNPPWDGKIFIIHSARLGGKIYMVRSARLGDSDVGFNALPLFGYEYRVLNSPRGVKLLSNTLAIECIRCNAKTKDGWTALMWASGEGHADCARLLLEHGADVNAKDGGGWTALMWASLKGHTDCARLLLEHGADVNAKTGGGGTALKWASECGRTDCVRLLKEHGAKEES